MIDRLQDHLPAVFVAVLVIGALFIFLYRNIAIVRKCPLCRETDVRRTDRTGILKRIPFVRLYFCTNCSHRFIRFGR